MKAFEVQWTDADIARVMRKVEDCRLPPAPAGSGWTLGCDSEFLHRLQRHWLESFDWQACQDRLNRYPQFIAEIDGLEVHFVHVKGEAEGRRPLLLTHGWPGSHLEFWDVIEPLAFPSRHGGSADQAFDLIIPSLPGFGFSGKPPGVFSQRQTAILWNKLMTEVLGYPRYWAQGGDWGSIVTSWLGLDHGQHVEAIHLNMLGFRSLTPPRDDAELNWQRQAEAAQRAYSGYAAVQMSKPQSIAWAAADNPMGQAAWILERFHDWADLRQRSFEQVFDLDTLLSNIVLYVMTGSFTSALWYYPGVVKDGFTLLPAGVRCETPTTFAEYSGDALTPVAPRSRIELVYNLADMTSLPEGGHFAAMEVPKHFVEDIRRWGASVVARR
ncbi:Pimeloyl-ACP methyl ester carboxylesterase [Pseudomonas mohnii]|uniref:Pimeloyl-ACP methyl ester carboxylesterase n=1 Tax=Pseudomonas mohnii TaxID=395600 RepID=A0ABY0YJU3_9PSED|nr:epoxide hydrolase family protein [Pseudomonas mohnii]SED64527.1 Pimeloyl-ACP methyl ester carboxylesterase [Pseudomonas mohnii]